MNRKAQVGMELMTAMVLILIILIVMTLYSIEKSQESKDIKTFIDAKRIGTSIADNLDTVEEQGKGYYKYFSIPQQIEGGYDYSVHIGLNVVEISWGERSWVVNTIASNVTVYCMDYGLNQSNRVWNRGDHLEITCYRPNIRPIKDSLRYWNDQGNVTISVSVENQGHVKSPVFNISIEDLDRQLPALEPYEKVEVNHTIANFPEGGYTVYITVDTEGAAEESIEADNTINETITI